MTRTHYQQIERGFWKADTPANPSLKVVVNLSAVLGIEPGAFLPATSSLDVS